MTRRTPITFEQFESGLDAVFGVDEASYGVCSRLSVTVIDLMLS